MLSWINIFLHRPNRTQLCSVRARNLHARDQNCEVWLSTVHTGDTATTIVASVDRALVGCFYAGIVSILVGRVCCESCSYKKLEWVKSLPVCK